MIQEKYEVHSRDYSKFGFGRCWMMTPEELLDRVQRDSKRSNYGWITSAEELVRTCNYPTFPIAIAMQIKDLILNCFANVMEPGQTEADQAAVFNCYCYSRDENLRDRFIRGLIRGAILRGYGDEIIWAIYYSPEVEDAFTEQKLQELHVKEADGLTWSSYTEWYDSLAVDFDVALDEAFEKNSFRNPDFFFLINEDI